MRTICCMWSDYKVGLPLRSEPAWKRTELKGLPADHIKPLYVVTLFR